MSNDPMELARYEATLRRQEAQWQAQCDNILHSDRVAAEIGISALKTAVLINAGALVALLALIGQLWDKNNGHTLITSVLSASIPFVAGLVLASVDFGVAYFYQSALTREEHEVLAKMADPEKATIKWIGRLKVTTAIVMILLALAAYVAFVCGIVSVMRVFQTGI